MKDTASRDRTVEQAGDPCNREHHIGAELRMRVSTLIGWILAMISVLTLTEVSACCGLNAGFGGTELFPVLLGSALLLWPLHFGYSRLVRVPVSWLGSLASSFGYALGAVLSIMMSIELDRQSGLLLIFGLALFLIGYSVVYRYAHRATVLKGLGFAILGVLVYTGTVMLLLMIVDN